MIFTFSKFILDVDVENTKRYYHTAPLISVNCSCNGCRNYEKAIDFLPQEVISFFSQFGIDMKKAVPEIYPIYAPDENTVCYGGWYHICGKILKGKHTEIAVSDNFSVTFDAQCDLLCGLLDNNFPLPALQLDIDATIPWVLTEKYE